MCTGAHISPILIFKNKGYWWRLHQFVGMVRGRSVCDWESLPRCASGKTVLWLLTALFSRLWPGIWEHSVIWCSEPSESLCWRRTYPGLTTACWAGLSEIVVFRASQTCFLSPLLSTPRFAWERSCFCIRLWMGLCLPWVAWCSRERPRWVGRSRHSWYWWTCLIFHRWLRCGTQENVHIGLASWHDYKC